MPTLPAFITYRPGKKAKAAIKAPFALLRGDSASSSSTTPHQQPVEADVIDINNSRYSLDFDGGKPTDSFEQNVLDDPKNSQSDLTGGTSPQVELDIDLSSNGLSDWFEAFSGAGAKQASLNRLSSLKNPGFLNVLSKVSKEGEGEDFASLSEDVVGSMDASRLSTLSERDDILQVSSSPKRFPPSPITITLDGSTNGQASDLSADNSLPSRPLSSHSDITASSALSGTTLARALMSNSFILSTERSSRYRSGIGAGLTRSDSTTLPRGERGSLAVFYNDRFAVGADAPPIPLNAEFLYEPPRKSRNEEKRIKHDLRRRSSTGSLTQNLFLTETPSISINVRPKSDILNADVEFDLQVLLPTTPPQVISRLPLPSTPTPRQTIDEATTPDPPSTPASFQEVTQQLPLDARLLSPDFNNLSPTPSDGRTSPKELEGLLENYYTLPDSPELLIGGGFRPMFSPISEESSSQLSPQSPYRSDRRDSQRSQPVGARSPLSGNRVRGDSVTLPRKDQLPAPRPQILLSVEAGPQTIIAPDSPSDPSDPRFCHTGDDGSDVHLAPPQLTKIFHRGSAPNPIMVVRDSRDMNAYNITVATPSENATPSQGSIMVSQEFPETPDAFSPMFSPGSLASPGIIFQLENTPGGSPLPATPLSAAILGRSNSHSNPTPRILLNRASVHHSRHGSLGRIRTTTSATSGSQRIEEILEAPEAESSILNPTADDAITEEIPQLTPTEPSASQSSGSSLMDTSRSPSRGPNIGQEGSDGSSSMYTSSVDIDSTSKPKMKSLPAIPTRPPIVHPSPGDESLPMSPPGTSSILIVLAEPIVTPSSPTPSHTSKLSVSRGRLPPALSISRHTSLSGPGGPIAINGTDQSRQDSPEPQHDPPGDVMPVLSNPFPPQSSLVYKNEAFGDRASDIFRGISLGSPPPYYSVVSEALMQDNLAPNQSLPTGLPSSSFHSQGSDIIAGPSSAESTPSRNLARENSFINQRARVRPPLPAGPRRPSQQLTGSPGLLRERGSTSSLASFLVPDSRARASVQHSNPTPSPSFQVPAPKWKGYTMEVAKWTFTSAQLQAIVSRAIRQSAQVSSIRLLRLEVLDNEIPEEIQSLLSQRTDIQTRYKASARKRAIILDSLYSSLSAVEDGNSTHRLLRQVDELKVVTQFMDRLAEEIYSVDQQLSHLESLTHIHTGSALAMALRKLNSSFLKQVAENQVLLNQIRSLEAERDEAWQQAQNIADEYDQINDNVPNPSKRSSHVSAIRKSCSRVSRAGLRTTSQRLSQRSSTGNGAPIISLSALGIKSPSVPPLPRVRPPDISIDSPIRSSATLSTSQVTPTSESRALARAQDELYAMLGIFNPERSLHRSRSEIGPGSPITATDYLLSPRSGEGSLMRRSSLPGALSLTEAYNVMAADRNAVLATIDMLSATESADTQ